MQHKGFYNRSGPFRISELADQLGVNSKISTDILIEDVKTLRDAGPNDIAFFNNRKYLPDLVRLKAGACLVAPAYADKILPSTIALVVPDPYLAFAKILQLFYPDSLLPLSTDGQQTNVSPTAQVEDDVTIDNSAIVGPEVQIGAGSRICAGAVIGYRSTIGRNCYIGPKACITHTVMGNNVTVHAGASIGQDGFGFAMGPTGHQKVPQIGRVIIQDDVDIGANTTIDRGALNDTIIGQGTKIDNLVQIGHNVVIGRHCVIVALVGIAGSCELGDFVVMAGKSGLAGHLKVGDGAQIAGASHPISDVPAGARMGGTPARPYRDWAKDQAIMRKLRRNAPT